MTGRIKITCHLYHSVNAIKTKTPKKCLKNCKIAVLLERSNKTGKKTLCPQGPKQSFNFFSHKRCKVMTYCQSLAVKELIMLLFWIHWRKKNIKTVHIFENHPAYGLCYVHYNYDYTVCNQFLVIFTVFNALFQYFICLWFFF